MQISLRPANIQDFDFCRALYFYSLQTVSPEQESSFSDRWHVSEVRIITCDSRDVGWLQSRIENEMLYLVQLFLESASQGQGIGTEIIKKLINEAAQSDLPMILGVVKLNPARRLYERLGFKVTHEDDRKFYMKHEIAE